MKQPPVRQCRSCRANIFWAVTGNGRSIPVDNACHPEGSLVTMWHGGQVVAETYDAAKHGPVPRHHAHFATCPFAGQHRKAS